METAESNAVLPEASGPVPPSSHKSTWRWSWLARLAFLFAGVVLPAICFLIGFPDSPSWQSGNLEDYAQLLLLHKPSRALYPFLLYNMTCMTLLVFAPLGSQSTLSFVSESTRVCHWRCSTG